MLGFEPSSSSHLVSPFIGQDILVFYMFHISDLK